MPAPLFIMLCSALSALLFYAPAALAAPQVLAVAATQSPLNFQCYNGICEVELSAMCLQKNRRFPTSDNVYHTNNSDGFTLVLRSATGAETRIPAGDLISLRSKRSFTAVAVRIPQADMESLGASGVALEVADGISLVPETPEHDMYPFGDGEVEHAEGPLRSLASGWLSGDDETTVAVRMVNQLINSMPLRDRMAPARRQSLWQDVFSNPDQPASAGAGHAYALYDGCLTRTEDMAGQNLRSCLEMRHDSMVYHMNTEYWIAAEPGS